MDRQRLAVRIRRTLVSISLLLLATATLSLVSPAAEAGNRYSDCGGNGQRACCAFPEFRLPSCDSGLLEFIGGPGAGQGPLGCSAGTCRARPSNCGRENQRACTVTEFIPSCVSGLVERLYQGTSFCRKLDSDGYPTVCGDAGERPCVITEKIPSCKDGNYEFPVGADCAALDTDGYPPFCGGDLEPACTIDLQVFLGITSCKPGFQEVGFPSGVCYSLDNDGYPESCGDDGEPGCTIDLQIAFGIASCKSGLTESPSIGGTCYGTDDDGYPSGCGDLGEPPCDIAVQLLNNIKSCKAPYFETPKLNPVRLECDTCQSGDLRCLVGGEIDFIRPIPQIWPNDEAPPGPRSIFMIHGLGSSANNAFRRKIGDLPSVLDDPSIGHDVYAVDYNAGNGNGSTPNPLRIFRFKRKDQAESNGEWQGEWDLVYTHPGKALDGTNFTVFEVAAFIADGIEAIDTADNISIVAHSLGGIMARHLVYRHYDELRNAGKRIAEVITFGSPHQGGGFGLPFVPGGSGLQEIVGCAGVLLENDPARRRLFWQLCQLERWQKGREIVAATGATIDNLEYPQIHWATVAGAGNLLNFFETDLPALDSDKVVAVISAHGLASDQCFPHLHDEFLPGINVVPGVTKDVNGIPALSADCYQADHIGNEDPNYEHVTELVDGNGDPRDHSGILVDPDAICFAKSVIARGLIAADADGDGVPYCRDNCTAVANPDQADEDKDGFGNQCDADFDNTGPIVNFADLAAFKSKFGTTDLAGDLDGSGGVVNFGDLARFKSMFGKPAGPSGTAP